MLSQLAFSAIARLGMPQGQIFPLGLNIQKLGLRRAFSKKLISMSSSYFIISNDDVVLSKIKMTLSSKVRSDRVQKNEFWWSIGNHDATAERLIDAYLKLICFVSLPLPPPSLSSIFNLSASCPTPHASTPNPSLLSSSNFKNRWNHLAKFCY